MHPLSRRTATIAAVLVAADQLTKLIAEVGVEGSTTGPVVPLHNDELSLGLADAASPVLAVLMALGIVVAGWWMLRRVLAGRVAPWAAAAVLAGALSNLIDRAVLGSVRDFLVVPSVALTNLADVAVVAGLLGAALANARRPSLIRKEVIS